MSDLLRITHLKKDFKKFSLFDIDLLELERAQAYVLTGKNGAGKSILLRILAGLETATYTGCTFMELPQQLFPYPQKMRDNIVYVHQHPIMFSMNVEDNIGYGLRLRHIPKIEIEERIDQAMLWAGVTHLRKRQSQGLSGGEKQRIALARAKILMPALLLLDEPSANLDGEAREQVIALIPSLIEMGTSVVIACHDRDLIHLPDIHHLKLREGQLENRGKYI